MGSVELPQHFWNKVEFEPNSGCWLWNGYTNHDGYGRVSIRGRLQMAHRATFGEVPADMELDHKCRVRSCSIQITLRLFRTKSTCGAAFFRKQTLFARLAELTASMGMNTRKRTRLLQRVVAASVVLVTLKVSAREGQE